MKTNWFNWNLYKLNIFFTKDLGIQYIHNIFKNNVTDLKNMLFVILKIFI